MYASTPVWLYACVCVCVHGVKVCCNLQIIWPQQAGPIVREREREGGSTWLNPRGRVWSSLSPSLPPSSVIYNLECHWARRCLGKSSLLIWASRGRERERGKRLSRGPPVAYILTPTAACANWRACVPYFAACQLSRVKMCPWQIFCKHGLSILRRALRNTTKFVPLT